MRWTRAEFWRATTIPEAINAAGAVTGTWEDGNQAFHGFVRSKRGAITTFDPPDAGTGSGQGTIPFSINAAGAITGYYIDTNGVYHSFLRAPNGTITEFDAPGAGTGSGQGTEASGNNNKGAITGDYIDASGVFHGFLANGFFNSERGDTTSTLGADDKGNLRANSNVVIDSTASGDKLEAVVGHEGSHVADAQDLVKSITSDKLGNFKVGQDITQYQSEQRAFHVSDSILRSGNQSENYYCGMSECTLGTGLKNPGQVTAEVDRILQNNYKSSINKQPLTPANQGGSVVPH